MFSDRLANCNDGIAEIHVNETKAVLDLLLPYCGQEPVPAFDLACEQAWKLIAAFHKYEASLRSPFSI